MSYTNPPIPEGSVQYFSNARGVYYLPSLQSEWEKSGYFPRLEAGTAALLYLAGISDGLTTATYDDIVFAGSSIFTGSNSVSIWMFYNERDHEDSIVKLKKLGINCVRTPLNFEAYSQDPSRFLQNVRSFLNICSKHKIRVQFILWDAEYNPATYFYESALYQEKTDWTQSDLERELAIEHPRNPYLARVGSWGGANSFVQASAIPYLEALAGSVSAYDSMWCFDLCNKPEMPTYKNLVLSSHNTLNQNLSSTDIKYTISFKNGINIFNDTGYLDNGKGTGPSGSYEIRDIQEFSGIIDFASVPFIANNDYAFKRYLNGAISGTAESGISKPFMVYATYDPELGQNFNETLNSLKTSSVGYFGDLGIVDSVFSFGKSRIKNGNVFWDGHVKDKQIASAISDQALNLNWYTRNQITKLANIKEKQDDPNNVSGGYFSGTPDTIRIYKEDIFTKINKKGWTFLKDCFTDPGTNIQSRMSRVKGGSKTYRAPFSSQYADFDKYSILTSSIHTNTLEQNLKILYDFDNYFPPLSSFSFSVNGDEWQTINKTIALRDEFLKTLSYFVIDYNPSTTPYAELRNSQYDTNPIPDYERGNLTELIELTTDPYNQLSISPITDKFSDLSSTYVYDKSEAFYGVADSGSDFSRYFDNYYSKIVNQLKKCLMWLYWKGKSDSNFKIVSDSFLDDISFTPSSISSVEIYTTSIAGDDNYTPGSLTSVQSPLYTVEVYNPSASSWDESFVFVVSGQQRQIVTGQANSAVFSGYWAPSGSRAPISFTTFGTSGVAKVRVKLPDGSDITSAEVYPKRFSKYREPVEFIYGSSKGIELETYIGDKLYIEINNVASAPLCIFADPFKPAIPEGLVSFSGQTRATYSNESGLDLTSGALSYDTINWNGATFEERPAGLYFPPGVHYVSAGLPLAPSSTVYVDANAYILGGFDVVSGFDSKLIGRGVISSELYPRSFIEDLKSDITSDAAGFYMPIGLSLSSIPFGANNLTSPGTIVEGLVLVNQAFYHTGRLSMTRADNCKSISPYTYNSDGIKTTPRVRYGLNGVTNSMMLCGDDCMTPFTTLFKGPAYYRNNFVGNYRSSVVATYYGGGLQHKAVIKDIDVLQYAFSGNIPAGQSFVTNALINIYTDAPDGLTFDSGLGQAEINNWDIHAGQASAVYEPMYHISNQIYVFAGTKNDGLGVLSGINITNINVNPSAVVPPSIATSSTIYGVSAGPTPAQTAQGENRPTNITFTNFKIGDNLFITDDNVDTYTAWINPVSATVSVTDPDSVLGADSNIVFKTT